MLQALRARDIYLVAGCAAAGAVFLACGALVADLALALVDPRTTEIVTEAREAAA
jgi:ABC-type dipeptide/oligopeptide/nickel transport system permease component